MRDNAAPYTRVPARERIKVRAFAIIDSCNRKAHGDPAESALIWIDGKWQGGDLLTVPRAKLPAIDNTGIDDLFSALRAVFPKGDPYVSPSTREPEPFEWPKYRRRDLSGNPNMLASHEAAVKRGEGEWLPDEEAA